MKDTVYIETSVVSYLTSRPSRNIIVAAHQKITKRWWRRHRLKFDLVISPYVTDEAQKGDATEAARRLRVLSKMKMLDLPIEVSDLATDYNHILRLPESKMTDALHLASA